ncbi:MAG: GNAT family N-acetyltransferase [Candidatus Tectimicrobiota bacterium]
MDTMEEAEQALVFPTIETERLRLRVLTLDDAPAVYQHLADDDVTRFMDVDECKDLDDVRALILFHANAAGCRWGVFDKVTGALLGTCGYQGWHKGQCTRAELGYDLGKTYWGQGLMQEALQAVIPFGFGAMHLQRIEACVHPENGRSIGLLRKLGFHREPASRDGLLHFHILPPDWATHLSPAPTWESTPAHRRVSPSLSASSVRNAPSGPTVHGDHLAGHGTGPRRDQEDD